MAERTRPNARSTDGRRVSDASTTAQRQAESRSTQPREIELKSPEHPQLEVTEVQPRSTRLPELPTLNVKVSAPKTIRGWHSERATQSISFIQHVLTAAGFYTATIDGTSNTATRNALLEFQRAAGLHESAVPDAPTLQRLGFKVM